MKIEGEGDERGENNYKSMLGPVVERVELKKTEEWITLQLIDELSDKTHKARRMRTADEEKM